MSFLERSFAADNEDNLCAGFYYMLNHLGVSFSDHCVATQKVVGEHEVMPVDKLCIGPFIYRVLSYGESNGLDPADFGFAQSLFDSAQGADGKFYNEHCPNLAFCGIHAARVFAVIVFPDRKDEIMDGLRHLPPLA